MWRATYNQPGELYDDNVAYDGVGGRIERNLQTFIREKSTPTALTGIFLTTRGSADVITDPLIAEGDVKISLDGGAFSNIAVLPTASAGSITVTLSETDTTCDRATILFIDQTAPKQWEDEIVEVDTTTSSSTGGVSTSKINAILGQLSLILKKLK